MTRPMKAASRLLLLLGITLSGAGGAAAATPRQAGPTTAPPPSISHLNNPSGHYTQDADGTIHARLYLAPIGLSPDPTQDSWHLRTPNLGAVAGTNAISVTGLPFALAVQQASPSADLTAEDGTALHLNLSTPGVIFQPAAAPLTATSPITYTPATTNAGPAPIAAVSWQPRFNGLLARVTITDAAAPAPITLSLTSQSGQNATISKDADGSIVVSHPQQVCGHAGCHTLTAPAFYILPPTLESPGDLAATGAASLFSLSLAVDALTLTANPGALSQIASHAPVTVDIPIETAAARAESGAFAPISSCVAADVVSSAKVLVGTNGACQERAVLYFDVRQLLYLDQFTLTGASLHLYTPDASGPTGVTVVPNAPGMILPPPPTPGPHSSTFPLPAPVNPPAFQAPPLPTPPAIQGHGPVTWNGAPTVENAAPSLQASADAGRWHSWDLTSQVGDWTRRNQTNTGITLEGSSLPVRFASPFDPANADLATTPYLDVTLTRPQATQGMATPNSASLCMTNCTYSDESAYPVGVNGENNPADEGTSGNLMGLAEQTLNAGLYRFSAEAYVQLLGGGSGYTTTVPCTNFTYSPSLWQGAYTQMVNAYAHHLIPVVVFQQQPNGCFDGNGNETTNWSALMQYFSYYMPNFGTVCIGSGLFAPCNTNPPMYFEIGNEPDLPSGTEYASKWASIYPTDFANGSQGLYYWLNYPTNGTGHPAYSNVHILTAGMDAPATGACDDTNAIIMAESALDESAYYGANPVPQQFLGSAVHPYSYMTNEKEAGYWENYGYFATNTACTNLDAMILHWRTYMNNVLNTQSQSPLLISETNFTSVNCLSEYDTTEREGPYQMDLYTWLYDHLGYYAWGSYPVRTLWYEEMDDVTNSCLFGGTVPKYLGLFGGGSGGGSPNYKQLVSPYYVGHNGYLNYTCPSLFGSTTSWSISLNYPVYALASQPCY